MPFTHYVKHSDEPLARSACHCKAEKNHYEGEAQGDPPYLFYKILRLGKADSCLRLLNDSHSPPTTARIPHSLPA